MKRNGMKKGWMLTAMFALALVLTLAFGLTRTAAAAETYTITYIDADGKTVTTGAQVLTSQTTQLGGGRVYTADKDLTINERLSLSGTATIVLQDGVKLKIPKGITVPSGKTLTICGQENNTGKLLIDTATAYSAGIGGTKKETAGKIIIAGGKIDVRGGKYAAGIGSGYRGEKRRKSHY